MEQAVGAGDRKREVEREKAERLALAAEQEDGVVAGGREPFESVGCVIDADRIAELRQKRAYLGCVTGCRGGDGHAVTIDIRQRCGLRQSPNYADCLLRVKPNPSKPCAASPSGVMVIATASASTRRDTSAKLRRAEAKG